MLLTLLCGIFQTPNVRILASFKRMATNTTGGFVLRLDHGHSCFITVVEGSTKLGNYSAGCNIDSCRNTCSQNSELRAFYGEVTFLLLDCHLQVLLNDCHLLV